jgi:predicted O-methyltransferase YrrM
LVGHYVKVNEHDIFGYSRYINFYGEIVKLAEDGATFVEVGSFLGQSTAALAQLIKNSQKKISLYAVDLFELSEFSDEPHEQVIKDHGGDFYAAFLHNLEQANVQHLVTPIKASSLSAAQQFEDRSLSFIMIDASHKYADVVADIEAWFPKMRLGGIISGDDYDWGSVKSAVVDTVKNFETYDKSTWFFKKQTLTLEHHRSLNK